VEVRPTIRRYAILKMAKDCDAFGSFISLPPTWVSHFAWTHFTEEREKNIGSSYLSKTSVFFLICWSTQYTVNSVKRKTNHSPTNALFIKLGRFKLYIIIHMIFAPTCFGLRPSSESLYWAWLKLYIYVLIGYVVVWQHVCNRKVFFRIYSYICE
jgi:hypothetical protein